MRMRIRMCQQRFLRMWSLNWVISTFTVMVPITTKSITIIITIIIITTTMFLTMMRRWVRSIFDASSSIRISFLIFWIHVFSGWFLPKTSSLHISRSSYTPINWNWVLINTPSNSILFFKFNSKLVLCCQPSIFFGKNSSKTVDIIFIDLLSNFIEVLLHLCYMWQAYHAKVL